RLRLTHFVPPKLFSGGRRCTQCRHVSASSVFHLLLTDRPAMLCRLVSGHLMSLGPKLGPRIISSRHNLKSPGQGGSTGAAHWLLKTGVLVVVNSGRRKHGALIVLWVRRQIGRSAHHLGRVHRN